MDQAAAFREFLLYVILRLVENPEQVGISHEFTDSDPKGHSFRVSLAAEDLGKLIGKNGQTIDSIRGLLSAAAVRSQTSATLSIVGHEDH